MKLNIFMMSLALMLLGCSNKPDVSLASLPTTDFETPKEVVGLPEISRELLVPCYKDLMPDEPQSVNVSDIINTDADNYRKHNECYKRQYELVLEVLLREADDR